MYVRFKNNIWAANLAEVGLSSSFNLDVKCLLCVVNIFTKCAWVETLKNKKAKTVLYGF